MATPGSSHSSSSTTTTEKKENGAERKKKKVENAHPQTQTKHKTKRRVLIFPKGNRNDLLAVYVDVANAGELAPGWSKEVQFSISIKNWDDETKPLLREANNVFSSDHRDWGFNNLIPWKDMDKGYISVRVILFLFSPSKTKNKTHLTKTKKTPKPSRALSSFPCA